LDSSSGETWDKITFDLFNTGKFKQYLSSIQSKTLRERFFPTMINKNWEMLLVEKLILIFFLIVEND